MRYSYFRAFLTKVLFNPSKPEKRFTYSEFLHDDDVTDDIFTPTNNDTPRIPEEPEPEVVDEEPRLETNPAQETCIAEQPEIDPELNVEPEPEVEPEPKDEIEVKAPNTNGVTVIDDEPTPEETDFDSFSGTDHITGMTIKFVASHFLKHRLRLKVRQSSLSYRR